MVYWDDYYILQFFFNFIFSIFLRDLSFPSLLCILLTISWLAFSLYTAQWEDLVPLISNLWKTVLNVFQHTSFLSWVKCMILILESSSNLAKGCQTLSPNQKVSILEICGNLVGRFNSSSIFLIDVWGLS